MLHSPLFVHWLFNWLKGKSKCSEINFHACTVSILFRFVPFLFLFQVLQHAEILSKADWIVMINEFELYYLHCKRTIQIIIAMYQDTIFCCLIQINKIVLICHAWILCLNCCDVASHSTHLCLYTCACMCEHDWTIKIMNVNTKVKAFLIQKLTICQCILTYVFMMWLQAESLLSATLSDHRCLASWDPCSFHHYLMD